MPTKFTVKTNSIYGQTRNERKSNFKMKDDKHRRKNETKRTEAKRKINKLMENFFYSIFVLFHVTNAFDNLLHFSMCILCFVSGVVFVSAVSWGTRDNIFILFGEIRWSFGFTSNHIRCLNNYSNQNKLPEQRVDTFRP